MHTPRSFVFACLALLFTAGFSGKASATSNTAAGLCSAGGNHYTTIQAAVNAAELLPTPRIVRVCPGTYPEQVLITGSLTLEGVSSGNSGAAIITAPVGGMVANATSTYGGPAIEAQVLVQNMNRALLVSDDPAASGSTAGLEGRKSSIGSTKPRPRNLAHMPGSPSPGKRAPSAWRAPIWITLHTFPAAMPP